MSSWMQILDLFIRIPVVGGFFLGCVHTVQNDVSILSQRIEHRPATEVKLDYLNPSPITETCTVESLTKLSLEDDQH